jgi:hypothetical protein
MSNKSTKWVKVTALLLFLCVASYLTLAYLGAFGRLETAGTVSDTPRPAALVEQTHASQEEAAIALGADSSQILFGDLHAHTTYSIDAFQYSLGFMGGEGAHPPADACDFARFCSALDFWSINDHAEHVTPAHWMETKESIRQCNATSGDTANPDMVAFLGWEWTHAGTKPENHYGHKNVILKDTGEDQVPTRPIHARGAGTVVRSASTAERLFLPLLDASDRQRAYDFNKLTDTVYAYPDCPEGVDVRDLPLDCREGTKTPRELFDKLDQWGFEAMVIPHGNSWGIYTAAGTTWDKQLKDGNQRSDYQFMIEMYSGHGNSEEYRDWRATDIDVLGNLSCPAPSENYLPSCWRAGQLIEGRCLSEGGTVTECAVRATRARQLYVDYRQAGANVVGGASVEDWLNSGQCTDCFQPAFNLRPGGSAQYALSVTNFDDPDDPQRFNFALMASSDNHVGRPGTGYKEYDRYGSTETSGVQEEFARKVAYPKTEYSAMPREGDFADLPPVKKFEHERSSSFFYTGGLVAVHSAGRDRDNIWNALQNKQVYGTSGERILLWFDLLNSEQGKQSMGSEVSMSATPRFRVAAVGAFKQKPGCPDYVLDGLTSERMESLCRGECYNPGDERKLITRVEIIRIRPQMIKNEPMLMADGGSRIEDIWKSFACEPSQQGCSVEFDDPDFNLQARDFIYYARAIQEPSPHINGDNLRTQYDENGKAISVHPCFSDNRTDKSDNCLAMEESRAWSSPIFVNYRNP